MTSEIGIEGRSCKYLVHGSQSRANESGPAEHSGIETLPHPGWWSSYCHIEAPRPQDWHEC